MHIEKEEIREMISSYKSDPTIADPFPDNYRRLLRLHYLECNSWRRVAVIMNYSEDNIYKLRAKALSMLKERIEVTHNVKG